MTHPYMPIERLLSNNFDMSDPKRPVIARYSDGVTAKLTLSVLTRVARDRIPGCDVPVEFKFADDEPPPKAATASELLAKAKRHMDDRAATYDKPEGERSMAATVAAFNAITGRDLQESEGWLLMQILKDVRDRQRGEPHVDSLEDGIAYSALKAEARLKGL